MNFSSDLAPWRGSGHLGRGLADVDAVVAAQRPCGSPRAVGCVCALARSSTIQCGLVSTVFLSC